MATGNEVLLAYNGLDINESNVPKEYLDQIKAIFKNASEEEPNMSASDEIIVPNTVINGLIEKTHVCLGYKNFHSLGSQNKLLKYSTPLGVRSFAPFKLELFFDLVNMGENEKSASFGVALSGRYFPTFLDWRESSGTIYPVVFNADLCYDIEMAKRQITKVLPWMTAADITVKEIFY
jgi:hypothetical protein